MNREERDQLRAKHGNDGDMSVGIPGFCVACTHEEDETTAPWPCDVIQVLDAWEATLPWDVIDWADFWVGFGEGSRP
jgi:hypothetical protein